MSFKRILVALDGSACSERMLAPLATFATRLHAELLLVRVACPSEPPSSSRHQQPLPTQLEIQTSLERLASGLTAEGLAVRTAVPIDTPAEGILERAAAEQVDVIALAPHGRCGPPAAGRPRTTWHVLTHSRVPVLVWREDPDGPTPAPHPVPHRLMADPASPILVPLDGSYQAERALPVAQALARIGGHPLLVIRAAAWPMLTGPARDDPGLRAAIGRGILEQAEHYLTLICQEVTAAGLRVSSKSAQDAAPEFIARCIREEHPALVVMMASRREGLGPGELGLVAQRVLSQAAGSILLVYKQA